MFSSFLTKEVWADPLQSRNSFYFLNLIFFYVLAFHILHTFKFSKTFYNTTYLAFRKSLCIYIFAGKTTSLCILRDSRNITKNLVFFAFNIFHFGTLFNKQIQDPCYILDGALCAWFLLPPLTHPQFPPSFIAWTKFLNLTETHETFNLEEYC